MIHSLAIRARILALATLLALLGGIAMLPSQASAEWSGYWVWTGTAWRWIWVWYSSSGGWIAG
jgi:hypothetical protein